MDFKVGNIVYTCKDIVVRLNKDDFITIKKEIWGKIVDKHVVPLANGERVRWGVEFKVELVPGIILNVKEYFENGYGIKKIEDQDDNITIKKTK